ncbi:MAG: OmpA family protein [Crocinitomicaceae bacterium]|nr:OmpA family protein [Crocinitomicaceae bacterium]
MFFTITRDYLQLIKYNTYQFRIQFIWIIILSNILCTHVFGQNNKNGTLYPNTLRYEGNTIHINPNYQYILEEFIEKLKSDSTILVHIRGHVCCRPGQRISRRRARKVYRFLIRNGIPKNRMSHKGYSNEMPLVYPERKKEDAERNRRVDFVLHKR